ncbi:putative acyl-coenzyme A synthetase ACSM2, mitochondrial-like protein [Operophtera brumata]|uniref:Putative acyl-coenzyme A synthetase ACSM2, mitochondrial-like protein n=1 Tax=Operophtera brumata TaxID=104452 RepID=A0A0L7LGR2_OPEBR|nr:putative acyl-coenzyme A synthetase ACSM2, mitochondrial-like protein [Operophtera brumata]
MLKYFIQDSMADLAICTQDYEKVLRPITLELQKPLLTTGRDKELTAQLYQPNTDFLKPKVEGLNDAGKSNQCKPKGVVWSHKMLQSQISALHVAWQYSCHDVREEVRVSVFHGVPAMYAKLCADHERMFCDAKTQQYVRSALATRMRLMCAGSAPLPHSLADKWEQTQQYVRSALATRMRLMCAGSAPLPHSLADKWEQVGMALSNPYRPVEQRTAGCVGNPLPGVAARIAAPSEGGQLEPLDEAGKRLAPYQLPRTLVVVDNMPRNVMGKLDKKEIRKLYGKQLVLEKK